MTHKFLKKTRPVGMFALATTAVTTMLTAACHRSPSVAATPIAAQVFGDTTIYSAQLLAFDKVQERVTVRLTQPSYVVVLAVVPGKSIEQISPSPEQPFSRTISGSKSLDLRQGGVRADPTAPQLSAADVAQMNNCISRSRDAANRRAQAQRKPVVRDSTGRIISGGSEPAPVEGNSASYENACKAEAERNARNREATINPTPRAPAERYLVVLASPHAMSGQLISERLESLVTSAPDVATTIEAIAQGLYAGYAGTWSGHYVSW